MKCIYGVSSGGRCLYDKTVFSPFRARAIIFVTDNFSFTGRSFVLVIVYARAVPPRIYIYMNTRAKVSFAYLPRRFSLMCSGYNILRQHTIEIHTYIYIYTYVYTREYFKARGQVEACPSRRRIYPAKNAPDDDPPRRRVLFCCACAP